MPPPPSSSDSSSSVTNADGSSIGKSGRSPSVTTVPMEPDQPPKNNECVPTSNTMNEHHSGPFCPSLHEAERPHMDSPAQDQDLKAPEFKGTFDKAQYQVDKKTSLDRASEGAIKGLQLRKAFGRYETTCEVATNHFQLNVFTGVQGNAGSSLVFHEYELKIVPKYFGSHQGAPELSKTQRRLIISAGLEKLNRHRCSTSAVATDFDTTLLSVLPIHRNDHRRESMSVCVSHSLHPSGDFTIIFVRRSQWRLCHTSGLQEQAADLTRPQDQISGSRRQFLLGLLISRFMCSDDTIRGSAGELYKSTEFERLQTNGQTTDLAMVRAYKANVVSDYRNGHLIRVTTRSRPCFDARTLSNLMQQYKLPSIRRSDPSAYDSIAAAIKGSVMRIGRRETHADGTDQGLRAHLDEALHSRKHFRGFGEHNPTFEQRGRIESGPSKDVFKEGKTPQSRTKIKKQYRYRTRTREMIEYQDKRHGWKERCPLPAADLGSSSTSEWFSSSKLTLLPYQRIHRDINEFHKGKETYRQVMSYACQRPLARASLASRFMTEYFNQQQGGSESLFYRGATVSKQMVRLQAGILPLPTIVHGIDGNQAGMHANRDPVNASKKPVAATETGACNRFKRPYAKPFSIGVIYEEGSNDDVLMKGRVAQLLDKLRQVGLQPRPLGESNYATLPRRSSAAALAANLELAVDALEHIDVVILYSERKFPALHYAAFKRIMDLSRARVSVCLLADRDCNYAARVCGVAAKINAKLNKSHNHKVDLHDDQAFDFASTMILGASLRHPDGQSSPGAPSIVALVSCQSGKTPDENDFGHYRGSIDLQTSHSASARNGRATEIIQDLGALAEPHLSAYLDKHGHLPRRIIYYRTGVNESIIRYEIDHELASLKEACTTSNGLPTSITAIVMSKQSSVRFFPFRDSGDELAEENCKPGTVVDTVVTSAHYHDFYLQSHHVSQGTARPTYYRVVRNELDLSATSLQNLTFKLCFGSQIGTQPLSQPVPTYYAGRLASRAKLWLRDLYVANTNVTRLDQQLVLPKLPVWNKGVLENYDEDKMIAEEKACCDKILQACHISLNNNRSTAFNTQPWLNASSDLQDCMFWL